jgi:type IV secretion system protein VirB9
MKANLLIRLFLLTLLFSNNAYALQESVSLSGDQRLRTYVYDPNAVYIYTGHYRYSSRIDLDPNEKIETISVGDATRWMISPSGHRIFLKPIEQDATTNMVVITDKRIYNFELYAQEAENIRDKDLVYSVSFVYPNSDMSDGNGSDSFFNFYDEESSVPDQKDFKKNPKMYNFNYSLSGSKEISPLEVFDDGEFTYIKFKDINADFPAIFQVMPDGNESLINFRVSGDYVIIEKVTSQFTLRHGNQVACIFNESRPLEKEVTPKNPNKKGFFQRLFGEDDDKPYLGPKD